MEQAIEILKVFAGISVLLVALRYLLISFESQHNTTALCKLLDRTTDLKIMIKHDNDKHKTHYLNRLDTIEHRIYATNTLTKAIASIFNTEIDLFEKEYENTRKFGL